MANPNIVGVTTINGGIAGQAVGTSATAIVSNSATSGKIYKVNALYVSNVDGTNAADLTVDVNDGTNTYRIASTISVAANDSIDVISKALYLNEGWSLRLTASAAGDLEAVASWEEIS